MKKYFVVDDLKIALLMEELIGKKCYKFYDDKKGKDIYTFEKFEGIGHIYGKAKTIIENL